jgi:hypothetical protein
MSVQLGSKINMENFQPTEEIVDEFDFDVVFSSSSETGSDKYESNTGTCAYSCGGTCSGNTCHTC